MKQEIKLTRREWLAAMAAGTAALVAACAGLSQSAQESPAPPTKTTQAVTEVIKAIIQTLTPEPSPTKPPEKLPTAAVSVSIGEPASGGTFTQAEKTRNAAPEVVKAKQRLQDLVNYWANSNQHSFYPQPVDVAGGTLYYKYLPDSTDPQNPAKLLVLLEVIDPNDQEHTGKIYGPSIKNGQFVTQIPDHPQTGYDIADGTGPLEYTAGDHQDVLGSRNAWPVREQAGSLAEIVDSNGFWVSVRPQDISGSLLESIRQKITSVKSTIINGVVNRVAFATINDVAYYKVMTQTEGSAWVPDSAYENPVASAGKGVLELVRPNCPAPTLFKYNRDDPAAVPIDFQITTDQSRGSAVYSAANPEKIAESIAYLYYKFWGANHPDKTFSDFKSGLKDGSIKEITLPLNNPRNPTYHPVDIPIDLTDKTFHIVFVNQETYSWRGKLKTTIGGKVGIYQSGKEIILTVGETDTGALYSTLNPNRPEIDLIAAEFIAGNFTGDAAAIKPLMQIQGSLSATASSESCP